MDTRSSIVNRLAETKIKMNRGIGLFQELKNSIYVGAALKILLNLSITGAIIATVIALFSFYIAGFIDLNYIKLFQAEQVLNTSKYNPHLDKIRKL